MTSNSDYNPYDRIEAEAEMVADNPDLADRFNAYNGTLVVAEIDESSLSDEAMWAVRYIAGCNDYLVQGVWDLLETTRKAAYDVGLIAGLSGGRRG